MTMTMDNGKLELKNNGTKLMAMAPTMTYIHVFMDVCMSCDK